MHAPKPYGLLNKGIEPTAADMAFIDNIVMRLANLKEINGMPTMQLIRELPDGGVVLVRDEGGIVRVITDKPPVGRWVMRWNYSGFAHGYVPSFYSGVITSSGSNLNLGSAKVGIRVTEQCRRRLANYQAQGLPAKNLSLERLAVEYNPYVVNEFIPKYPGIWFYSQYGKQLATWYSGAMGEVMQIVGGYGRQDFDKLPNTAAEQAFINLPEKTAAAILKEMGDAILPACYGYPDTNGQYWYDYKFNKTHLVSIGADGTPWLVQISSRGVYAMPLPMIPATCTAAFREYMETVNDTEVVKILDRFGGMPSGETFPRQSEDFDAWVRAGVIIKVCDTADFYSHSAYASSCGWTANLDGTEIANTCFDYDENGLGLGYLYQLNLRIGAVTDGGRIQPTDLKSLKKDEDKQKVALYVAEVLKIFSGNSARSLAVRYKLRRIRPSEILARVGDKFDTARETDYWENLEMRPIVSTSGQVKQTYKGGLFSFEKFAYQPQIKFPEPLMGGCISHDFAPSEKGADRENLPDIDTPVFVYFVGDDMKTVKYFRNWGKYKRDVESNYEEVMITGSWYLRETSGYTGLYGAFYSTDIDERKELSEGVIQTDIVGEDKGYDSKPWFSFDSFFWRPGTIWRNRYYTHKTNTYTKSNITLDIGICIPFFMRNAVLHARREKVGRERWTEALKLHSIRDPYSYRYWTHHSIYAWAGGITPMNGNPYPKDGNPVWVEYEIYTRNPYTDFSDSGSWISGFPADFTWLVHPDNHHWYHSGGGGAPKVREYSKETEKENGLNEAMLTLSINHKPNQLKESFAEFYFIGSPDQETGLVFYRDGCKNLFGDSEYCNVDETVDSDDKQRFYFGKSALIDEHNQAFCFLGVVNE